MMVTDIVRDDIVYADDWGIEPADPQKQIEKYKIPYVVAVRVTDVSIFFK